MRAQRDRRGFTLVELLIVVVIIGILAAIAIPKFSSTREKAFRSAMVTDLKNVATAQEVYHMGNNTYAGDVADLALILTDPVVVEITEAGDRGWAAAATHAGVPSGQCGIFYGEAAAASGDPATAPGVVTCNF